ncbi:MAG TPA: ABC transporter permease, partial [Micromonospora sp.]
MAQTDTAPAPPVKARAAAGRSTRSAQQLNEIGLLVAIIVVFAALALTAPGFLSLNNMTSILRDAATIGVVAWAATLVIVAGEIDISLGPAVAFASVVMAEAAGPWGLGIPLAMLVTVGVATLLGAGAGVLRAFFNVPSFIATLALFSALRGLALFTTTALPVPIDPDPFLDLLAGSILGVPTPAVIMLVLFAVFSFVARRTAYGRSVYAVGGNAKAAFLAGIPVRRIRVLLFMTTGLMAGLAGILLAARLGSGNGGAATGLEFDIIAAVVIGGTALTGGRGSMLGTLFGVVFITIIGNGL